MFWKKYRRGGVVGKLNLGVDVKRCSECLSHIRPCLADDKPAMFHRWVEESGNVICADYIRRTRETFALVEYPDGSVGKVKPELIMFLDTNVDKC